MSRIINIGDFYRAQTSFPSVIGSLEIPETKVSSLETYGWAQVISAPETSGTSGPIELLTFAYPPNVGFNVFFELDIGLNYGHYLVTETGNATGDATGGFYFNIAAPIPADMTSTNCFIYFNDLHENKLIRIISVETGSSGDTTFITTRQEIFPENLIVMINGTGDNTTFPVGLTLNNPSGSTVFITGETGSTGSLDRDYTGYNAYIQVFETEDRRGNPISTANAHAKRQFGNHPRRRQ